MVDPLLLSLSLSVSLSSRGALALAVARSSTFAHLRILALEEGRGMLWSSDLEEGMTMRLILLAFLTEIEVRADAALVADPLNWVSFASITGDTLVNLRSLLSSLFAKVVNHEPLESLGSVGLNLFLDNLNKISVELVLESA